MSPLVILLFIASNILALYIGIQHLRIGANLKKLKQQLELIKKSDHIDSQEVIIADCFKKMEEKDAEIKSQHEIIEEQIKVGQEMAESHNKLMEKIEDLETALESSRQEIEKWKAKAKIEESEVDRLGKEIERLKEILRRIEHDEKHDHQFAQDALDWKKAFEAERQSTRELMKAIEALEMETRPSGTMADRAVNDNLKIISRHKAGGKVT